mmetsp:Transcript_67746/g.151236  ORF Transcript_67746/g.151236 Transcript_67746/m.151236 type:complete len:207 (-) Transcript_67746:576-1196(-)
MNTREEWSGRRRMTSSIVLRMARCVRGSPALTRPRYRQTVSYLSSSHRSVPGNSAECRLSCSRKSAAYATPATERMGGSLKGGVATATVAAATPTLNATREVRDVAATFCCARLRPPVKRVTQRFPNFWRCPVIIEVIVPSDSEETALTNPNPRARKRADHRHAGARSEMASCTRNRARTIGAAAVVGERRVRLRSRRRNTMTPII